MPSEQIVFAPEIDERQLDREVGSVNDQLSEVGQNVPVNFDPSDVDLPGGIGGGVDAGGGGGMGATGTAGVAGLASRLPKSVAGVTASAALPIAIAGSVGMGMLDAMRSSSAMLKTDTKLLGIAVDNFFREPGNILSEFVTRPLSDAFLDLSVGWDEAVRDLRDFANGDILPDNLADFETRVGLAIDALEHLPGPVGKAARAADDAGAFLNSLPRLWNGWPDISLPSGFWPDLNLPGDFWPDLNLPNNFWPDMSLPSGFWPHLTLPDVLDALTSPNNTSDNGRNTSGSDTRSSPPGPGTVGDDTGSGGDYPRNPITGPTAATGGRITKTGTAKIHRGELVASPDRLVRELSNAIADRTTPTGGGQQTDVDTRAIEDKLDRLHRDMQSLSRAMSSMALQVDGETFARAATENQHHNLNDVDPTV